jgi:ATP phosphoribosyltransferase
VGDRPRPESGRRAGELRTTIEAVIAGRIGTMMNARLGAVGAIEAILPGLESPSVLPLAHEGMVAVHAVVSASDVHRILVPLREAGATGILVVPVEKLLP